MATTSNVLEALKYTYGTNRVLYLFNEESVMFNILSRVKKPVGGRGQFILPIVTQNAGAFKGIAEGGALPTALQPDTAEATFSLQEYTAIYDVSWKLIQDARNDKFAFQQAVQMLDEGLKRRIFRNLNSDLLGRGTGELFTITGADVSTVVTSAYLPRVEKGMVVDVIDETDNTTKVGDSLTVEAVDPIARTVDLSGALTGEAAGDYGVIEDTLSTALTSLHSNGILGVIDDANPVSQVGNYGGINRSTAGNEFWKAVVLSNGGVNRPLTEDLLLQSLDAAREKGGTQIDAYISNLAVVRRYHEMLASERFVSMSSFTGLSGGLGRKGGSSEAAKDGKTVYEFSGVPWHVDPYFVNNQIVGLDTKHFFLGVGDNEVPRPISEVFDNVPFFRQTANATFEVAWYYQMELLSDNPASGVKIEDIAEA